VKPSKPPALATWLVEHMVSGVNNEALAGDLLEQFGQGRSAGWYWRQVIAAIFVGIYKEQRIFWIAAGIAPLWMRFLLTFWQRIELIHMFGSLMGRRFPWPWSLIYFFAWYPLFYAVPISVALGLYFLVTRTFSPWKFLQGLMVGFVAVDVSYVLGVELSPFRGHFAGYIFASVPLFVALTLSMWTARPNHDHRERSKISI
jgi:hypothetical protein